MIDLPDLTFVFPLRIYCEEQILNLNSIISLLNQNFETHIIILEADSEQKYSFFQKNTVYNFIYDTDPVFHKAIYVNKLMALAKTPFIAVWNENAIVQPDEILEAINILRDNKSIIAIPYDGRVFSINYALTNFFRQTIDCNVLSDNTGTSLMTLSNYYSSGITFLLNKEKYSLQGGENINFYGFEFEDEARKKRLELCGFEVSFSSSPLYILAHNKKELPILKLIEEKKNVEELLKIYKTYKV